MRPLRDLLAGRRDPGATDSASSLGWPDDQWQGWVLPRAASSSTLATLGAGSIADVDERGRVALRLRPLSIDFWIGAGDRWIIPSQEAAVRQRRVDGLPVVETRIRVGEADVVLTAWADEPGDAKGRIVVDVRNETGEAVVLAVVVRPFTLRGVGRVGHLRVVDALIVADGRPVVNLPRPAGDTAVGSRALGDILARLSDELVGDDEVRADDGTATLAAMLPVTKGGEALVQIVDGQDRASVAPAPLDRTLSGWKLHLDTATTVALPGWPDHLWPSLTSGMLGAVRDMSLPTTDGNDERSTMQRCAFASGLDAVGLGWACDAVIEQLLTDVETGTVGAGDWFALATVLARRARSAADSEVFVRHGDTIVRVVGDSLDSGYPSSQRDDLVEAVRVAAGDRAASDAAELVPTAAPDDRLRSLALLGSEMAPTEWASVEAARPRPIETVGDLALSTICSARIADVASVDPLVDVRRLAGSTWAWPDGDDTDSAYSRAILTSAILALVVEETATGVDVLPGFADGWLGRSIDVTALRTRWGSISFAVRWHGARPALLWELVDKREMSDFRLTCRRLDPIFSTTDDRGEALLEAPSWADGRRSDRPVEPTGGDD